MLLQKPCQMRSPSEELFCVRVSLLFKSHCTFRVPGLCRGIVAPRSSAYLSASSLVPDRRRNTKKSSLSSVVNPGGICMTLSSASLYFPPPIRLRGHNTTFVPGICFLFPQRVWKPPFILTFLGSIHQPEGTRWRSTLFSIHGVVSASDHFTRKRFCLRRRPQDGGRNNG